MESSDSDRYILSPLFLVASLGYNIVPKGRLRISRQLGSRSLLEDREVSMLNRVLEFRICGWLDNESGSGDGLAACGSLLLREGLGGRRLYT
jgi:hypothetical protein